MQVFLGRESIVEPVVHLLTSSKVAGPGLRDAQGYE